MKSEKKLSPVAIVLGSDSDLTVMQSCIDQFADFGIEPVVHNSSSFTC